MAIVWPCPLSVDAYAAAGRDVEFPRPDCPECAFGDDVLVGISAPCPRRPAGASRSSCRGPAVSVVARPTCCCRAFVLAGRLDVAETVGSVLCRGGRRPGRRAAGGGSAARCLTQRRGDGCVGSRPGRRTSPSRSRRSPSSSAAMRSHPVDDARSFALGARSGSLPSGERPAGMALDRAVALRLCGERREAARHQHRFALPRRRQNGVSCLRSHHSRRQRRNRHGI